MPFAFLLQLCSALPSPLTHRSTGTNCDALTSCTSCVPYSACGWCASSSTCLNADPFSPKRRAANTRCFAPAWMHGVDVASECPTSGCHANSHAEPCRLDEACGWCTSSSLCLPRAANASCASGWDAPVAAAAWVAVAHSSPPRRPPCVHAAAGNEGEARPAEALHDDTPRPLEPPGDAAPAEGPAPPFAPCTLPPDTRATLLAGNTALQREVELSEQRLRRKREEHEAATRPKPVLRPEWGGSAIV